MQNPWLTIPLEDYEGHMAMPDVGQAEMLASEFAELLKIYATASVALIGCAGGNGFDDAAKAGVERVVGLDINPNYIADAEARFTDRMKGLELYCADIERDMPDIQPVHLVYGALVFEYVDIAKALANLRTICGPGAVLAALLQLPKEGAASVTPSPYVSLKRLSAIMRLVPPDDFRQVATLSGFIFVSEKIITLGSGKQFSLLVFKT
jgi:SAM-dependent methyltransferase